MNATMSASTASEIPSVVFSVREIPLDKICESKTNPRREFDEGKLAELADSIRQHGVLQAVVVRPYSESSPDVYELVAGTRRYRASKLVGRETIPANIRELTDAQCLELQLIENLQRSDIHELDEAEGYAALMQMQPDNYTVETIAITVGRSEKYVTGRLRLLQLIPDVRQAFYGGKLTFIHAFEIARLQPNDQRRALQECFPNHKNAATILRDKKAEAATVRELREWIEREVLLDLTNAPFDTQDETLLPSAGSCTRCAKRTGNNPLLFPDVRQKSTCTDRECFRAKVEALIQIRVKPLEEKGEKPLRVSEAPSWQSHGHTSDVLHEGQFHKAKGKEECPSAKSAVFVDGKRTGAIFYVCQDEKCPVHAQTTKYERTPQERKQRAKERMAERVEKTTRERMLNAVREKLPETLSRQDLELVALDYVHRLGNDNQRRLCRAYGWEEKKTKTAWGSKVVQYGHIASVAVTEMAIADLNRFLVTCALVSDLYCPGYNPSQSLTKESNLARTAARYRVDAVKLAEAVRKEFSQKAQSKQHKTVKTARDSKKTTRKRRG